jgi:hypothetical protein
MNNFSSPFMFKSPLNDLRKANSSRKTKKREPMKDCKGFNCSKSETSLNKQNKTKTRTKDPMRGGYKKLKKKEQDK